MPPLGRARPDERTYDLVVAALEVTDVAAFLLTQHLRIGITLMTSPRNFRQSWWHNRDYGVFVANPFGRAALKQGAPSTVTVKKGASLQLLYGAMLHDANDYSPVSEYRHFLEVCNP